MTAVSIDLLVDLNDPELEQVAHDWLEAKAAAEQWTDREKHLASILIGSVPESCKSIYANGQAIASVVRMPGQGKFDRKRFRADFGPEMFDLYVTPGKPYTYLRRAR